MAAGRAYPADTTAAFLKLGFDARTEGLGNSCAAATEGAGAAALNPGALALIKAREFGFTHSALFGDIRHNSANYAQPLENGAFGLGIQYLTQGAIEQRDSDRRIIGEYKSYDRAVNLAYGRNFGGDIRLGLNVKYLTSVIEDESASGFAFDLGGVYELGKVRLGLAARNMGSGLKFMDRTGRLPLSLAFGAAYRLNNGLLLAFDIKNSPYDRKTVVSLGTEYTVFSRVFLRAGYTKSAESLNPGGSGIGDALTGGMGLNFLNCKLDYAFSPYGELGNIQKLSLAAGF